MMIRPVFCNYRPQRTGTQAVNLLNGKKTIRGYLTRLHAEVADSLVKEEAGTPYVAGGAVTEGQDVLAGRLQSEGLVKRGNPVDFNKRYTEVPGY